jgi:hypothetical protein
MGDPIKLTSEDSLLRVLNFKPFRSIVERRVTAFEPPDGQPQTLEVHTPWGTQLTAKSGDMLVSEMDTPDDVWPVDPQIFDESYIVTRPGFCVKRAITLLVPLLEVTHGDPDQLVTIETLEGTETVRAGDFYLAKGVKGEIWPYPKEKVDDVMVPAE